MIETPADRYYRAMEGTWRGRLVSKITDPAALAACELGAMDRLAWKLTALFPARLETRVSREADGRVLHETRIGNVVLDAVAGAEHIALDADGRRFTLRGAHRFAWTPWRTREVVGTGEVADDASGASYAFEYLGASMTQTTRREGEDALVLTQKTAFGTSEVRLERQPPARVRPVPTVLVPALGSVALAWLRPEYAMFPLAALCLAFPILAILLASRRTVLRARWALGTFAAFVALLGTSHLSNERADAGLDRIRASLLQAHAQTGRYPDALVAPPDAGLPGTLRTYCYEPHPEDPIVSYPTLGARGVRVVLLVASGAHVGAI